jgi:two-component system chemotaxis response regulator CheB
MRAVAPLHFDADLSSIGRIVAVGASTGGVEALQTLLTSLPANAPPILVTQHMPAGFSASFAARLDKNCAVTVHEATHGQPVMPGHVYVSNGSQHLQLFRSGAHYICHLSDAAPVSGHRPSVDVLFSSFSTAAGKNGIGIILTGMGQDGAAGLLEMRKAGARTLGQNEQSCVIYGMPKVAKTMGAVEAEWALTEIPRELLKLATRTR